MHLSAIYLPNKNSVPAHHAAGGHPGAAAAAGAAPWLLVRLFVSGGSGQGNRPGELCEESAPEEGQGGDRQGQHSPRPESQKGCSSGGRGWTEASRPPPAPVQLRFQPLLGGTWRDTFFLPPGSASQTWTLRSHRGPWKTSSEILRILQRPGSTRGLRT